MLIKISSSNQISSSNYDFQIADSWHCNLSRIRYHFRMRSGYDHRGFIRSDLYWQKVSLCTNEMQNVIDCLAQVRNPCTPISQHAFYSVIIHIRHCGARAFLTYSDCLFKWDKWVTGYLSVCILSILFISQDRSKLVIFISLAGRWHVLT